MKLDCEWELAVMRFVVVACFSWKELLSSCDLFILQSALTGVDAPENEVDLEIQS